MNRRNFVTNLSAVGLLGALPAWAVALASPSASASVQPARSVLDWRALDHCAACAGRRYRVFGSVPAELKLVGVVPGHGADDRQFIARFRSDVPLQDGLYELGAGGERRLLYLQASSNDPHVLRAEINLAG